MTARVRDSSTTRRGWGPPLPPPTPSGPVGSAKEALRNARALGFGDLA